MFVKLYSPDGAVINAHPVNVAARLAAGWTETPPKKSRKSAAAPVAEGDSTATATETKE